jgi:phosphatidylserine/phosphatidylglycerophosphate/cardiolipin synthase-like enzyme
MRHMSNCIVRAEREVFLATNYWQDSVASKFITDAIRELDRRAGKRGTKIVFKIIYDRGSPKQLIEPHYIVSEKEFTGKNVKIPAPHEIPNIEMQVMNFHTPLLGTFHAKYMVVDRKIAILQSNNIQDNDNVEMMSHFEGPIVDSLYDMALISWNKKMEPPLPSSNSPAAQGGISAFGDEGKIFGENGEIKGHSAVVDPRKMKQRSQAYGVEKSQIKEPGAADPAAQLHSNDKERADELTGPTTTLSITHPHPAKTETNGQSGPTANDNNTAPDNVAHGQNPPHGSGPDKATQEFVADGQQPISQSQIQEPSPPNNPLPEHTHEDPHYDDDIAGEIARVQTSVSPKPGVSRREAVTRHLNHTKNPGFEGDPAPEPAPEDEMTPYIPHRVHEPFPMAMVCRSPYGPPDHKSVDMPQNAAWLSALRNAKKNVFIQSPTLNAEPLLPAIHEACERGIDVYCYICLGYNDAVSHNDPYFIKPWFYIVLANIISGRASTQARRSQRNDSLQPLQGPFRLRPRTPALLLVRS